MLRLHSHMLEFPLMKVLLESLNKHITAVTGKQALTHSGISRS